MKIFGREINLFRRKQNLFAANDRGLWHTILDWWPGRWQQDTAVTINTDSVIASPAVNACITLIANDFGKLRPKLVQQDENEIWQETSSASFSPVLRKPNSYQNHIQFKQWWQYSLQTRGNTYGLKQRDNRGVVVAIYLLDPSRVTPLVTDNGEVYYELQADNLSNLKERVIVPASEIIHDRINCIFHPLVGLSPIFACGLAATKGLTIENNAAKFFANQSRPSGVLTAPGRIEQATADRLKVYWDTNFTGENQGKVAVLGDGLKYEAMTISPVDAQMLEQLKWSAEIVCSTFHVPPFKIGVGVTPTYQNAEVLNQIYYSDCLQVLIEQFELCMDEGLGLTEVVGKTMGVELDLDALLRMDQATQVRTLGEGVKGGVYAPNEARKKLDLKPLTGGNTVYLQQQQFSLEALAKRDAKEDPFATGGGTPTPQPTNEGPEPITEDAVKAMLAPVQTALAAIPQQIGEALKALPAPAPAATPAPPIDDEARQRITAIEDGMKAMPQAVGDIVEAVVKRMTPPVAPPVFDAAWMSELEGTLAEGLRAA